MTQSKVKRKNDEIAPRLQFTDVIRFLARLIYRLFSIMGQVIDFTVMLALKMIEAVVLGGADVVMFTVALPFRLLRYLIIGRIPKFENTAQEEAFWRIKRRYRRRFFLGVHQIIFMLASFYLIIDTTTPGMYSYAHNAEPFNQLLPYMLIWLIVLAGHYFYVKTANAEDAEIAKIFEQKAATKVQYVTAYTQPTARKPTYTQGQKPEGFFSRLSSARPSPFTPSRLEVHSFDDDDDDEYENAFDRRKKRLSSNTTSFPIPFARGTSYSSSMTPIRKRKNNWDEDDLPF